MTSRLGIYGGVVSSGWGTLTLRSFNELGTLNPREFLNMSLTVIKDLRRTMSFSGRDKS